MILVIQNFRLAIFTEMKTYQIGKMKMKEIFRIRLKTFSTNILHKILKIACHGCLRREKPFHMIQTTSSVLLHTAKPSYVFLPDISANILYFLSAMGSILRKRSNVRLLMICTCFAKPVAFMKFGAICGHLGILKECGSYGHTARHLISLIYTQLWALKIFGGNSSIIIFIMLLAPDWIILSGYSSIVLLQPILHTQNFWMTIFTLVE